VTTESQYSSKNVVIEIVLLLTSFLTTHAKSVESTVKNVMLVSVSTVLVRKLKEETVLMIVVKNSLIIITCVLLATTPTVSPAPLLMFVLNVMMSLS
jgi:hypothetical protein